MNEAPNPKTVFPAWDDFVKSRRDLPPRGDRLNAGE